MPAKRKPGATARDGTHRGRPTKPGKGKPSRTGKALAAPLTPAMEQFVLCWMVRRNATRAYMDSHPDAKYSTALAEGSKLFRDPRVALEIKHLLKEEMARLRHSAPRIMHELSALGLSCLSDVYTKSGTLIAPADLPRGIAVALKKVKRKEIMARDAEGNMQVIGHTVEVEMHDKLGPLTKLGLEHGLFTAKIEHSADDDLLQALRDGRTRSMATS